MYSKDKPLSNLIGTLSGNQRNILFFFCVHKLLVSVLAISLKGYWQCQEYLASTESVSTLEEYRRVKFLFFSCITNSGDNTYTIGSIDISICNNNNINFFVNSPEAIFIRCQIENVIEKFMIASRV